MLKQNCPVTSENRWRHTNAICHRQRRATEPLQGTSETAADTDHDGLSDKFETNTGWTVPTITPDNVVRSRKVHSSPLTCDPDGDKSPDLHVSGNAFSEFTVHKAKSFTKDGKDISKQDCARLAMAGKVSKIRLFPVADNWSTSCIVYTLDEMVEPDQVLTRPEPPHVPTGWISRRIQPPIV